MLKRTLVYFIALGLFVLPALVFAGNTATPTTSSSFSNYSEDELVALIAKMQKQLEEIRKNKVQCALANVDLSIGDGEDDGLKEYVKNLQSLLKEKGYFTAGVTGYFGKVTRASMYSFQKSLGLEQNGVADSTFRTKIKELKCKKDYSYLGIDKTTSKTESKNETKNTSVVTAIKLYGSGTSVNWAVTGYSKNGYKLVWSKKSGPTYPLRDGDQYLYFSDPSTLSSNLEAFNGSGLYYVRVCEYLGGSCGVYSNEISLSL